MQTGFYHSYEQEAQHTEKSVPAVHLLFPG